MQQPYIMACTLNERTMVPRHHSRSRPTLVFGIIPLALIERSLVELFSVGDGQAKVGQGEEHDRSKYDRRIAEDADTFFAGKSEHSDDFGYGS